MLLSAVSVLVVAQSSSEIPEGLMNSSVHIAYPLQQWLHERASMLHYTYIACIVEHNLQYLYAIAPSPPNVQNCVAV